MKTITTTILIACLAILAGCATQSVDKDGNDCVVGKTCPGILVHPLTQKVIEEMRVIGVNKAGSEPWNTAIRIDAKKHRMTEEALRAKIGDRDFVQVRKDGFMYLSHTNGGLYANGLSIGDIIDVNIPADPLDATVSHVVRRAAP